MKLHYLINGMQVTDIPIDTNSYKFEHLRTHSLITGSIVKPFMQEYEYEVIGAVPNMVDDVVIVNLKPHCKFAKEVFKQQYKL